MGLKANATTTVANTTRIATETVETKPTRDKDSSKFSRNFRGNLQVGGLFLVHFSTNNAWDDEGVPSRLLLSLCDRTMERGSIAKRATPAIITQREGSAPGGMTEFATDDNTSHNTFT